jgi:hypothetical protein
VKAEGFHEGPSFHCAPLLLGWLVDVAVGFDGTEGSNVQF